MGIVAIIRSNSLSKSVTFCLLTMIFLILLTPYIGNLFVKGLIIMMVYVYWQIAYNIIRERDSTENITFPVESNYEKSNDQFSNQRD